MALHVDEQQDIVSSYAYIANGVAFLFPYEAIRVFIEVMLSG